MWFQRRRHWCSRRESSETDSSAILALVHFSVHPPWYHPHHHHHTHTTLHRYQDREDDWLAEDRTHLSHQRRRRKYSELMSTSWGSVRSKFKGINVVRGQCLPYTRNFDEAFFNLTSLQKIVNFQLHYFVMRMHWVSVVTGFKTCQYVQKTDLPNFPIAPLLCCNIVI